MSTKKQTAKTVEQHLDKVAAELGWQKVTGARKAVREDVRNLSDPLDAIDILEADATKVSEELKTMVVRKRVIGRAQAAIARAEGRAE